MRAAGDAGLKRDPATVTAHHLNHHHAMARSGGCVNLVDCIRDGMKRGIESKRHLGGGEIIIDRLWYSDDLQSLLKKLITNFLRSITADADDGVDTQLGGVGNHLAGNVARHFLAIYDGLVVEGIAAVGGAENGSAAGQNAGNFFHGELEGFFGPDEPVETIRDADDFPSIFNDGSPGGGADDSVEARCVPASSGDTDAANF